MTPCTVERRNEDNARSDGSKVENRCEQGQCQTKRDEDDAGDGDDKNRAQMTSDEGNDMNEHSQVVTSRRYRALVARISYLSQDRPDFKFASMRACCAMANRSVSDTEQVKTIGRYLAGDAAGRVSVPLATEW